MNGLSKIVVVLLAAIVLLLAANFVAMTLHHGAGPDPAWANIVSGKNHFTTQSPDGKTVYLWYYNYEPASETNAKIVYLGQIQAGGTFGK